MYVFRTCKHSSEWTTRKKCLAQFHSQQKRHVNISTLISTYPYLWYDIDRWSRILFLIVLFRYYSKCCDVVSFESSSSRTGSSRCIPGKGLSEKFAGSRVLYWSFERWTMTNDLSLFPKKNTKKYQVVTLGGQLCSLSLSNYIVPIVPVGWNLSIRRTYSPKNRAYGARSILEHRLCDRLHQLKSTLWPFACCKDPR